jgi:tetraacyldisaccharide 4'-kinase
MREPGFWWREPGVKSDFLAPLAAIYGFVTWRRMLKRGGRAGLPVICVGNFTLGGSGKTPTVMMLARMLTEAGERPFCLTRGYGGSTAGPRRVDAQTDHASLVGDEALLLARVAPTIVARNRRAGAALAKEQGASVVIMDDGLQNASIIKDFSLTVVDGRRGIGNGKIFPAGPLRAPLRTQLKRSDALLVVGEGDAGVAVAARAEARKVPVLHGRLAPDAGIGIALKGRKVLAFAGIGDPEKFFTTARAAGVNVVAHCAFPDHHRFSGEEAARLIMEAEHDGLALLTTEKDRARMIGDPLTETLAARVHVLAVTMQAYEADVLLKLMMEKLGR